MGLFGFLKGKKEVTLGAPVKGACIPICEVNDPTFAEEILGKGMAIKPADGRITAPVDGIVSTLFPTGHALGMTTEDGIEILIHVGLDTVQLEGQYFRPAVKAQQKVKKGELLLEADLDEIRKAGYDTVIPVIICNSEELSSLHCNTQGEVNAGEEIITYSK